MGHLQTLGQVPQGSFLGDIQVLQQKIQVRSGRKFSMTLFFRSALLLLGKEALLFAVQINYKERERKEEKIKKGK